MTNMAIFCAAVWRTIEMSKKMVPQKIAGRLPALSIKEPTMKAAMMLPMLVAAVLSPVVAGVN